MLVNLELVRLGFATVTSFPPDVKYIDELYSPAQRAAVEAGIGLWGTAPTPVPTPAPTAPPAAVPLPLVPAPGGCDPSYPDAGMCIPIGAADLNCGDIAWRRFTVLLNVPNPDPHGFDGNKDGVGCES
jgi:micrococcal nuclease